MSDSRTFPGVTPEILSRMKELGRAEHNIAYDPPDGPVGTATSQTPLGECVIEFAHDAADRIYTAIVASTDGTAALKPILRPYDTRGSTQ